MIFIGENLINMFVSIVSIFQDKQGEYVVIGWILPKEKCILIIINL